MKKLLLVYYPLIIIFIIIVIIVKVGEPVSEDDASATPDSSFVILNEYNLLVDSLNEFRGNVGRNQTLADLLLAHDMDYQLIHKISTFPDSPIDVKKIKVGNNFAVFSTGDDTSEIVKYFVYEMDPINFAVVDLTDSLSVYAGKKDVTFKEREVAGVIEYSLWETLTNQNISPVLAIELSEIFAWQIDFFTIQRGDSFKVKYEEKYIGEKLIGVGKIFAACFNHNKESFYSFRFEQDDEVDYFDEMGNSLRKAFLKAPLRYSRISSRFSNRRFHPVLRRYRPHHGIDYAAAVGTPVQAVGDGFVTQARYQKAEGRIVRIKHNGTYSSAYLHLSKFGKGIKVGAPVKQGQVVGYVGNSGLSTGPHLDFRFYINGSAVNYLNQKFPSTHPVKEIYKEQFNILKDSLKNSLESIPLPILADKSDIEN